MESQRWLKDLPLFISIARAKSFARAADALGMSGSAVSRRMADFEKELGLRLLNRTTRRVELTEDGVEFLARAEKLDQDARNLQDDMRQRHVQPSGHLRVAMPESVATRLAIPWIADFLKKYPKITLDIHTAPDFIDPIADQFDLCIHDHPQRNSSLTIRNLASFNRNLCASPDYIAQYGLPSHPADLAKHQCLCLGTRDSGRSHWRLARGQERLSVAVSGAIVSSSLDLGYALAMEGIGIASIVTDAYADDVRAGLLIPVLPDWQCEPLTLSAIMPTALLPTKARLFLEYFAVKLKDLQLRLAESGANALARYYTK
jgi:DNA-binding transcriptional LysR family regulator